MTPKFSLQTVLDYRRNRLDTLEIELGSLLANQQSGFAFLEKLQDYQIQLFYELHSLQVGDMDLPTIYHLRANLKIIEARIQEQRLALTELEQQILKKRAGLVEAKQDEETLLTLKNKEVKRYNNAQARQEIRLQDDIYIAQHFSGPKSRNNK